MIANTRYPNFVYSYYITDIGNNWGHIDNTGNWTGAIRMVKDGVSTIDTHILGIHRSCLHDICTSVIF